MKKIALSVLSAVALTACVDARHVQDPQGQDYLHIKCSSLNSIKPVTAKCQARAATECPGGYTLLGGSAGAVANSVTLVLKCDRNAAHRASNVSSFTAYAKINPVSEAETGLMSGALMPSSSAAAARNTVFKPAPVVAETKKAEADVKKDEKKVKKEVVAKKEKAEKKAASVKKAAE